MDKPSAFPKTTNLTYCGIAPTTTAEMNMNITVFENTREEKSVKRKERERVRTVWSVSQSIIEALNQRRTRHGADAAFLDRFHETLRVWILKHRVVIHVVSLRVPRGV
jgi:hypothetical protein|tara:strand:- start:121 stop:444 length:324 start_codon:yes stop_codon:yes gene_type:complete